MTSGIEHVAQRVATGLLPDRAEVAEAVAQAYEEARANDDGDVADHIPSLAEVDPDLFGICVTHVDGGCHDAGDAEFEFSIQSISKAFVYALVSEAYGPDVLHEKVGVNNTGLPFNSVMAIELNDGHPLNPMVNAGALATTAQVTGDTPDEQWDRILTGLSAFAGRPLELDEEVHRSEAGANQRNEAIARLLESYGRIEDPVATVDLYTKQCSLRVSAHDLAVMGATLADGGVNPVTGEQVVSEQVCRDTLAVLASTGMYEKSGEWLFRVGLPGKSGVSGGIVTIAPGKGGMGVFSPRLGSAGNSVRGEQATAHLSRALGLNIFASGPYSPQSADGQA
ncbi:glutaminase A [Nocardioides gilvus]|uniref:glutaminase A n=1 Tax=Nocardioides gilvus TaxID=1735589 RepID=UPI000D748EBB|nr:glutaminase A [Nocardioides gilvus]